MRPGDQQARPPIRVLVVDDHPAIRSGLALLLSPEGITVCAEAESQAEALQRLDTVIPDLAIVDLSLDGEEGLALVAALGERGVKVLAYTMHKDARHVSSAVAAGAVGYVTKRELPTTLVQAIHEVAAGRRFLSQIAAAALAESVARPVAGDDRQRLSPHERRVYDLLGQGADTSEIATALAVSAHTVDSYYKRILVKLDLGGMHELRRRAIRYAGNQAR